MHAQAKSMYVDAIPGMDRRELCIAAYYRVHAVAAGSHQSLPHNVPNLVHGVFPKRPLIISTLEWLQPPMFNTTIMGNSPATIVPGLAKVPEYYDMSLTWVRVQFEQPRSLNCAVLDQSYAAWVRDFTVKRRFR